MAGNLTKNIFAIKIYLISSKLPGYKKLI